MRTYDIPLVPGPTRVPRSVRAAYLTDYGSADLEPEYVRPYQDVQDQLRANLGTDNRIAFMTGEGMTALWGALMSCLRGDSASSSLSLSRFGGRSGGMRPRGVGFGPLLEVVQDSIDERGVLDAGDHFALAEGPLVWQRPLLAGSCRSTIPKDSQQFDPFQTFGDSDISATTDFTRLSDAPATSPVLWIREASACAIGGSVVQISTQWERKLGRQLRLISNKNVKRTASIHHG